LEGGHTESHRALQKKSLELVFLLAIPISATFAASASGVVGLLYGPSFSAAVLPFAWASPLVAVNCLTAYLGYQVLFPLKKERLLVIPAAAGAAVSLSLNLLLIPGMGSKGAVVAALAAEVAVLVVQLTMIWKFKQGSFSLSRETWKYAVASLALGITQWILMPRVPAFGTLVAAWSASFVVYALVLWATREPFTRLTWSWIRQRA
jgi:O-antigen/teichoic acid export membrane protein